MKLSYLFTICKLKHISMLGRCQLDYSDKIRVETTKSSCCNDNNGKIYYFCKVLFLHNRMPGSTGIAGLQWLYTYREIKSQYKTRWPRYWNSNNALTKLGVLYSILKLGEASGGNLLHVRTKEPRYIGAKPKHAIECGINSGWIESCKWALKSLHASSNGLHKIILKRSVKSDTSFWPEFIPRRTRKMTWWVCKDWWSVRYLLVRDFLIIFFCCSIVSPISLTK